MPLEYMTRVYSDQQSGRVACFDHLGSYGQSAVSAKPNAAQWVTPLDVWTVMSKDEQDDYRDFLENEMHEPKGRPLCETCRIEAERESRKEEGE
jgi:hypothetical protein